jgi:hypothetical protein
MNWPIACFSLGLMLVGLNCAINAKRFRLYCLKYYEKASPAMRILLLGDWLIERPRLHLLIIRLSGFGAIGVALLLVALQWLAAYGIIRIT